MIIPSTRFSEVDGCDKGPLPKICQEAPVFSVIPRKGLMVSISGTVFSCLVVWEKIMLCLQAGKYYGSALFFNSEIYYAFLLP